MARKGLSVWIFSSLTFLSLVHLVEAIYVLISGSEIRLLDLYPFIGDKLGRLAPITYLWASAFASLILWGITCAVAFENPMEEFLNRVLSDAKKQNSVEAQLVQDRCEILDAMYETIEASNATIGSVKDLVCNVRTEVKEIHPLTATVETVRHELCELAKEVERLDEKMAYSDLCLACGKPLLPEFKMCPYCGEDSTLLRAPVLPLNNRK